MVVDTCVGCSTIESISMSRSSRPVKSGYGAVKSKWARGAFGTALLAWWGDGMPNRVCRSSDPRR